MPYSEDTRFAYEVAVCLGDPSPSDHANRPIWDYYGRNVRIVLECVYGAKEMTMLEELKLKRFEAKQRKRQRQAVDRATARAVLANCERTTPWIIQPAFPVGRVFWGMLWRCGLICGCVGGLLLAGHLL